jgi:hypothetical protein
MSPGHTEKFMVGLLKEMTALGVLEFVPVDQGWVISEKFYSQCNNSVEFFKKNPDLIKDSFDDTLVGIFTLSYISFLGVVNKDKLQDHVAILMGMYQSSKNDRLAEFGARLRILGRVRKW